MEQPEGPDVQTYRDKVPETPECGQRRRARSSVAEPIPKPSMSWRLPSSRNLRIRASVTPYITKSTTHPAQTVNFV
jgi:hypothetical protein